MAERVNPVNRFILRYILVQADLRLDSGVFGLDHAVRCNQRIRARVLFLRADRPLLYTSGKYRVEREGRGSLCPSKMRQLCPVL